MRQETCMNLTPPIVLSFSGNDPSGGSGLASDILTLASLGCHVLPIITAVLVQDSATLEDMIAIDADWLSDQARFILEDMPVKAFKIGTIGSIENMAAIAEVLADYPDIPVVLDPSFLTCEDPDFLPEEWAAAMRELLVPYAHIVVVNSTKARLLLQEETEEETPISVDVAAQRILQLGCEYVLMSGVHENTPKLHNTLYHRDGAQLAMEWERVPGSFHGKGSTLSAALAGSLAFGSSMEDAFKEAQEYTWQALTYGYQAGMGKHIPDRLFWARKILDEEAQEK